MIRKLIFAALMFTTSTAFAGSISVLDPFTHTPKYIYSTSGTPGSSNPFVTDSDSRLLAEKQFDGLMAALNSGQSTALNVLGDSTGVSTTRWAYLVTQWLAAKYPTHTVKYLAWNDTTQGFDQTILQTGTAGTRYAQFFNNLQMTIPSSEIAALGASDVDIRVNFQASVYPPAANSALIAKYGSAGQFCFRLLYQTTGTLFWGWSEDGTATKSAVSTTTLPNNTTWVRITHQVNNGAAGNTVTFYTSSDGVTWSQLGNTVVQSGTTSFFNNSATPWSIGGTAPGGGNQYTGYIYSASVRSGTLANTSIPIGPQNIDAWTPVSGSGTIPSFGGAPELVVVNGSMSGASIAASTGGYLASHTARMALNYSSTVVIISDSHNEVYLTGASFLTEIGNYITSVKTQLPLARVVWMTQNPRNAPALYIREHAIRRSQFLAWAKQNGYDTIDIYRSFQTSTLSLSTLLNSDGIHPSDAYGSPLWAQQVENAMLSSQN